LQARLVLVDRAGDVDGENQLEVDAFAGSGGAQRKNPGEEG